MSDREKRLKKSLITLQRVTQVHIDDLGQKLANLESRKAKFMKDLSLIERALVFEESIAMNNIEIRTTIGAFYVKFDHKIKELKGNISRIDMAIDVIRDEIVAYFAEKKKYEKAGEKIVKKQEVLY